MTTKQSIDYQDSGVLEWLISGNATARLLDFFVTYKDFDYSETDIAESSRVSPRTVFREIPKFESIGLIKFTRNVGRAKMFKLNPESEVAKYLEKLVFEIASRRIENVVTERKTIQEPIDEKLLHEREENTIENSV